MSAPSRLFIGNLPFSATEVEMKEAFGTCGNVMSVQIVTDPATGRSKRFAFVAMATEEEAKAVIEKYDGSDYAGKAMTVSQAKSEGPRPARAKPEGEAGGARRGRRGRRGRGGKPGAKPAEGQAGEAAAAEGGAPAPATESTAAPAESGAEPASG